MPCCQRRAWAVSTKTKFTKTNTLHIDKTLSGVAIMGNAEHGVRKGISENARGKVCALSFQTVVNGNIRRSHSMLDVHV